MGPMQRQILRALLASKETHGERGLSCNELALIFMDTKMWERSRSRRGLTYPAPWRPTQLNAAMSGMRHVPTKRGLRRHFVVHSSTNSPLERRWTITRSGVHALEEDNRRP